MEEQVIVQLNDLFHWGRSHPRQEITADRDENGRAIDIEHGPTCLGILVKSGHFRAGGSCIQTAIKANAHVAYDNDEDPLYPQALILPPLLKFCKLDLVSAASFLFPPLLFPILRCRSLSTSARNTPSNLPAFVASVMPRSGSLRIAAASLRTASSGYCNMLR